MAGLDDIIQQLQQQAGPRGSTFAGRRVGSDPTTAAQVISQPAQEATDEGFSLHPELMAELAKMSPLMALGMQSAKKGVAQELGPLEKLIIERGKAEAPMLRQHFRPTLTLPDGRTIVGGQGGYHGDIYPHPLLRNFDPKQVRHGFATPEGIPVSDEAFHLLTGPPELLKIAGQMMQSGTRLDDLLGAIGENLKAVWGK